MTKKNAAEPKATHITVYVVHVEHMNGGRRRVRGQPPNQWLDNVVGVFAFADLEVTQKSLAQLIHPNHWAEHIGQS